jgi:hypothetical protein
MVGIRSVKPGSRKTGLEGTVVTGENQGKPVHPKGSLGQDSAECYDESLAKSSEKACAVEERHLLRNREDYRFSLVGINSKLVPMLCVGTVP